MSHFNFKNWFAYLLAPVLLTSAACSDEEEQPPVAPLPAVAQIAGGPVVRVLPGQTDSLFTVHAEADGLWLQESSLLGESRFRRRLAADAAANGSLAIVPASQKGVIVATREDGFIAVRHIEAGKSWTVGTFILGDSLLEQSTRIVGVYEPVFDAADLYVEQGGELIRVRFPLGTADQDRHSILDVENVEIGFTEVVGLGGDRVAALSPGEGSAELRVFDGKNAGIFESLTPGVGSVATVVGQDADHVYVRVELENGGVSVHRDGGQNSIVYTSPYSVSIDADASGISDVWLSQEGFTLVEGRFGEETTRSFWLGAADDVRVDEIVILPAGRRAMIGERFGLEGVFILDPLAAGPTK